MENVRSFIAIDFCQNTLQQIRQVQIQLSKDGIQGIRWMKADNLHITLKFLGNTTLGKLTEIIKIMNQICAVTKSFELCFEGMGVFPGWANPRILWLGFERSMQLQSLAEKIETACNEVGFEAEKRPLTPHLTIGRFNESPSSHNWSLMRERYSQFQWNLQKEKVTKIHLYRSVLKPSGAEYSQIHTSLFNG